MQAADSIVLAVVTSFLQRAALGHKKCGATLERTDLKPLDWIQRIQDELMDEILYLEKLKKETVASPCRCQSTLTASSPPSS